jgi:DNA end-binding protein Ku
MARSIWTGSISFGLVTIPVRVFSAIREHDVQFHQLAPDGSRIHLERVSEKSGRKVEFKSIKKGYETSKGKWVVIEPDELKRLAPTSTKAIEIEDFVALEDIDPIYFERTYHLVPQNDSAARAYALLASVMADKQRIGIGKVVMREKQYLAAIRPYGKGLAMSTMLFADEVIPQSDIEDMPTRRATVAAREKKMAAQIVDALARDWDPKRYHDDYQAQVRALVKGKAKGEEIEAPQPEESAKVLDLTEALRASLESGARRPGSKSARPAPRKATRKSTRKSTRKRAPARRTA